MRSIPAPRLRALAIAVLSTCAVAPVWAQSQTGQTGQTGQQLPEVSVSGQRQAGDNYAPANATTATKIDAPLRDVPQTVNVVTQEVIRDQGARSLADILKNIPGVGLATGDGQRDAFVLRGFTSLYDQYLDGVRDDGQYFRDLYNIERVEILKGPAGVLYGRGSSGGLINRVTKKPEFKNDFSEIGYTTGSYKLSRTEGDVNRQISDTVAIRFMGAYEDSGSFRNQGYLKNKDFSPSLLWKDGNQSLLLQFDYQYQRRSIDFGVPGLFGSPVNVPVSTVYGSLNAEYDYTQSVTRTSTAQYKLRLSDDTSFTNTFRYSDFSLDRNHTRAGTINAALATVQLSRGQVRRDEHGWYNQSELTHNVRLGATSHKLLAGLEIGEQDRFAYVNNTTAAPYAYNVSIYNPVLQNLPFYVTNTPGQSKGYAVQRTTAVYAQSLSTWTDTIKTLVGLRYDNYVQKYDDQLAANADLYRADNKLSPRAGIVWQPTVAQSYYASWSRSFQPSSEGTNLAVNNANIAPEKTVNVEVGTKIDILDGKASFTGAVYQLTRSDIKVTDPSNTANLIPVGEQRTNGLELGLNGEIARGWQLIAGYSFMDGKVTKAVGTVTAPYVGAVGTPLQGKVLALTPRHTASLWTLKSLGEFGLPGVQVGGGVTYRGENYASLDNAVKLPNFTTVDLGAYYRPAPKGISLALNFKNIFNKVYYISANNDSGILPGAPRTVELTARYKF